MIAKLGGVVIDCPEPRALAPFYEALLGVARAHDSELWVTLSAGPGTPTISLQQVADYRAPDWSADGLPQQLHLDLIVDDLVEGEALVLRHGGRLLEGSDKPIGYRVYADPVGHPFCLVTPEGLAP